jgi:CIC family chloride channel protein
MLYLPPLNPGVENNRTAPPRHAGLPKGHNEHALGLGGLFNAPQHTRSCLWNEYLLVVLVALAFSALTVIVLSSFGQASKWFFGKFSPVLRALVGAGITGSIGVLMAWLVDLRLSDILGVGEKTINEVVAGVGPAHLQVWWVLLLAIVAKALATLATIHSGGGAGTLIPAMYIGGLAGAMAYYLLGSMGWPVGPIVAVYAATGMAAALTLIAGVPLAAIAMVIEIFGAAYSPPAALACGLCFLVSHRFNIFQQHYPRLRDPKHLTHER